MRERERLEEASESAIDKDRVEERKKWHHEHYGEKKIMMILLKMM